MQSRLHPRKQHASRHVPWHSEQSTGFLEEEVHTSDLMSALGYGPTLQPSSTLERKLSLGKKPRKKKVYFVHTHSYNDLMS
jgi:hypothetical protein